ncbi:MAG TPA: DNA polymerase III subunit delta [Clostridiales bacterium]|jgi:DNA polymerase-3 subunit delta|nr:DNA polymerase III subunit delta [Clostridiales bacterium]
MAYSKKDGKNEGRKEYSELKKAISDNCLKPLYVLWGRETYLKEYYFKEMKKLLLPEGMEEFNHKYFEGKNIDLTALADAVDALPVFSERTLVEVRDFDFYNAGEEVGTKLERIISDIPDYCCLVFFFSDPEFKPIGTTRIHQALNKIGASVEFGIQEESDLIPWLARRFAALNRSIDRTEAQYMLFLCGDSMTNLIREVEKIAAYSKSKKIRRADIDAVGTPEVSARVFDMTDAIAKGDFDRAAGVMADLLELREHPIKLLAIISKQLRQLYYAKLCLETGKDASYLKELCEMRKIYPARLLMENAKNVSLDWCENAVKLAAETDYLMKSDATDDEELLKIMLMKLAVDRVVR